ncbi:MAG TPA: HAD-IIIC family phosphatase [Candidatus Paceibacterota bacterium]|nr:HAD-IIIC family phosphatase [Candidatus Paceibacterota bacterium]
MTPLSYIKRAGELAAADRASFPETARISLVTNFTDAALQKLLTGIALAENVYPEIYATPYKQYHFELADAASTLSRAEADLTWFFFDANPYVSSEFTTDATHLDRVLDDIERYIEHHASLVVLSTFVLPYDNPYGNLFATDPLFARIVAANERIAKIAAAHPQVTVVDTNQLIARIGAVHARDLRASYAFDVPFTNEFFMHAAEQCLWRLLAVRGHSKKCIVLDLDNTLWGGIVGEVGVDGIALGGGYPGTAYQEFQRTLKEYAARGILLAIASRNNPAEVDEVFAKNTAMVLQKDDFAAVEVGWGSKAEAIQRIAERLNIGLDSLMFLDDDAANREEVRSRLPMVTVPELPQEPEAYTPFLLALPHFTQLVITAEDRERNAMYAAERKREAIKAVDPLKYLEQLGVEIMISVNDPSLLPRLAQLTQKTNQYNLTTKRYALEDLHALIARGARLYAGEVKDRFGTYGTTVLAIVDGTTIDTFLMSCRVAGRGVAESFLDYVIREESRSHPRLQGVYRKTAKNEPVRDLLPDMGFAAEPGTSEEQAYVLDTAAYDSRRAERIADILKRITITAR